ncbi:MULTISPECIES: NAD(P)/FAD-dependent oxidoreductase [unclassified Streptomyces]|uniref:FAD-dependent oxidoreductase n=1 Tax=unclassified Streptomyces TaxID=2593676 RepID=UPI00081E37AB|nr:MULTISPECIES: NAD(P)/FAD-dependent oxidoreductase [unclassified Streptomyces]MYZ35203.1 FAD-dependent oxidoreductase [Streptomyces sp. SID4917]SCF73588.1 3-(3-hydroxy-phenyl)propionate hydroxylase [Streptomyces sp. MnatMP-M17]
MTFVSNHRGLPVLILGGGPVGVTAAWALARAGVRVHLIEREPEPRTDWRASTFHPPTLELLDELGVAAQMHTEGLAVPRYQYRDRRAGLVAEFDFTLLKEETKYPHRLQLNQQHLVRMLVERLADEPNATLHYGIEATAIRTGDDGVVVEGRGPSGETSLRGCFLVAADGASSTARGLLGVEFKGFTYPERFLIASTSADFRALIPDIADVNYVADPDEWLFLLRTPESWRAVYPVPPGQTYESATDPAEMQSRLQGIAALPGGYEIGDRQIYHVHQRVADSFLSGPCALIGDAAHINSPLGGVGLNSGIHDAVDLARRLARIVLDGADEDAELAAFAEVRRRVAVEYVQADTKRNTERISERDEAKRQANHQELRAVAADPERARAWCRRASLLESVARFGIGLPPEDVRRRMDAAAHSTP